MIDLTDVVAADRTLEERLRARSVRDGDCLLWTGSTVGKKGYGQLRVGGMPRLVHRVAYTLWVGPIPQNMTVDHRCRRRNCIEPTHLRLMTAADNVRESARRKW